MAIERLIRWIKKEKDQDRPRVQDKSKIIDLITNPEAATATFSAWQTDGLVEPSHDFPFHFTEDRERSGEKYITMFAWDLDSDNQFKGRFGWVGFNEEGELVSIDIRGNFDQGNYYTRDNKWYEHGFHFAEKRTMEWEVDKELILDELSRE